MSQRLQHHRCQRPSLQVESLAAGDGLRQLLLTNRLFNQSIYLSVYPPLILSVQYTLLKAHNICVEDNEAG